MEVAFELGPEMRRRLPGTEWEDYAEGPGGGSMSGDTGRTQQALSRNSKGSLVWQGQRCVGSGRDGEAGAEHERPPSSSWALGFAPESNGS